MSEEEQLRTPLPEDGEIPARGESSDRRVLVVDDDVDFADTLVDILRSSGFRSEQAHDPRNAISRLEAFGPQVALIDIRLVRESGIELIAQFKKSQPRILCVMMTAYAATETAIEALHEGAYDYLRKPLHHRDLLATLERCFEKIQLESEKEAAQQALKQRNLELAELNMRLRVMVESAQTLTACSHLEELGRHLVDELARHMAAEGASLFFCEPDQLRMIHATGPNEAPASIPFPLREGSVFAHVLQEKRAIFFRDIRQEKDLSGNGWNGYRDGSIIVYPLLDNGGRVMGVISLYNKKNPPFTPQDLELGTILVSLSREVMQSLQAAEALRKSEERFRSLVQNASDVTTIHDMAGAFLYDSPSAERILGYPPRALLGRNAFEYVHPDDVGRVMAAFERVVQGRILGIPTQYRFRRADGSWIHLESVASNLLNQPEIRGIVINSRDVSERKRAEMEMERLEEQLRQSQKLEAIGLLAGGVAHDFNNLLTAINGYSEMLLRQLDQRNPLRGSVEVILQAGERAAGLTRQLLAFSRRQVLQPKVFDLNVVISDLQKMLRRVVGEDMELVTELAPDLGMIKADPGQIEQVIINLAVNARDASPKGGRLTLATSNVELDETQAANLGAVPGTYVVLRVRDTGCGMDEEILNHIFEPFFTTKQVGKGTGLGLSTVYGIVSQSGGFIQVSSRPGEGTDFKVYLPCSRGSGKTTLEPESPTLATTGSETVLLVEDEELVRLLAHRILEEKGYTVLETGDPLEALRICQENPRPIHLLVTDVVMPGMDGIELSERLTGLRPKMKTLFISGYTDDAMVRHGLLEKEVAFLQKPFSSEILALRVREVLDSNHPPASVLVVDDDEEIRSLLSQILRHEGYEVVVSKVGKEALQELRHRRFDLLIMDLVLPEQEGLEMIRRLKKEAPGLKIIAISGAFEGRFLKMAEMLGAHASLRKPLSERVVLNTIQQLLTIRT